MEGGGDQDWGSKSETPSTAEEVLLSSNNIALSAIHDALDERTFEQIKNIEMVHEAWKKLEEWF